VSKPTKIEISATLDTYPVIRCWTCYPHQIRYQIVDTDNYTREIPLPRGVTPAHLSVVPALAKWQASKGYTDHVPGQNCGPVILAYQVVQITVIKDNRKDWGHASFESHADTSTMTKKIFVYEGPGARTLSWDDFFNDAAWVEAQRASKHPDDPEFTRRHLSVYTLDAYKKLSEECAPKLRHASDARVLKLGAATYVPLGTPRGETREHVVWRPEKILNNKKIMAL